MITYNFTLSAGKTLPAISGFESNGVGSMGNLAIDHIDHTFTDFDALVVTGDYTHRFKKGFTFYITQSLNYDMLYTVAADSFLQYSNTYIPIAKNDKYTKLASYTVIEKRDETATPSISYNISDQALSSLFLIGPYCTTYKTNMSWGEALQTNLLHMTEHWAATSPPVSPLEGQIYFNTIEKQYYSFYDNDWHLTCINSSSTVTKQYVDSFAIYGAIWKTPIFDPNLVGIDSIESPEIDLNNHALSFIVATNATGAWEHLRGHAVQYRDGAWLSLLGRPVKKGDRFGVLIGVPDSTQYSVDESLQPYIGQIVTVQTTNPLTFTSETPVEPDAVCVDKVSPYAQTPGSYYIGHAYTFNGLYQEGKYGVSCKWVKIQYPTFRD